jgi:hypothetical protein
MAAGLGLIGALIRISLEARVSTTPRQATTTR